MLPEFVGGQRWFAAKAEGQRSVSLEVLGPPTPNSRRHLFNEIVVEAEDGQHAVEVLAAAAYDVMFLDLSMPRMSGEEVVRWLRAHPDVAPGLRIVVVSAWAGDKRPTLHELGVDAVLPKPFRKQQLLDLLEELAQPR